MDGQQPDDLTLIPWQDGRCATWDVTATDTIAASYLSFTSSCAGSAVEAAATQKEENIRKSPAIITFFYLHLKHSVPYYIVASLPHSVSLRSTPVIHSVIPSWPENQGSSSLDFGLYSTLLLV